MRQEMWDRFFRADTGMCDAEKMAEALDAAERELAGVRKVEAWNQANPDGFIGKLGRLWVLRARTWDGVNIATGDTIAALGHALSPEVPDTPREATGGR